ncbi:MAG: hypothetical protein KBT11_01425 [Treponema sp.]|nr:hypothetical protein [Candidatus Treponema equifaecale]
MKNLIRKLDGILFAFILSSAFLFSSCIIADYDEEVPENQITKPSTKPTLQEKIDSAKGTLDLSSISYRLSDSSSLVLKKPIEISGKSEKTDMKNAVITVKSDGVVLSNLTNVSKLIIDASVGDGDFTIIDSDVEKIAVNGGGSNSIHLNGVLVKAMDVEKEAVRIVLEKGSSGKSHSKIENVEIKSDCKLDSTDEQSEISRVIVAKEVSKVSLAGNTVVSAIVVNATEENIPKLSVESNDIKIAKGLLKKDGMAELIESVIEAIENIIPPSVKGMTPEEILEIETGNSKELQLNSPIGAVVIYNGKEHIVTYNTFNKVAINSKQYEELSALNTVKDMDARKAALKEYDNIETDYIELFRIPGEGSRTTFGNGTNSVICDYFEILNKDLKKVAQVRYDWKADQLLSQSTYAERNKVFEATPAEEIRKHFPEIFRYENNPAILSEKLSLETTYKTLKAETISEAVVYPDLIKTVSIKKDFAVIDGKTISKTRYNQSFDEQGNRTNQEYDLSFATPDYTLDSAIRFYVYDDVPGSIGNTDSYGMEFRGNGFTNRDIEDFKSRTKVEFGREELYCYINNTEKNQTTFAGSIYGTSQYLKESGDDYILTCEIPLGTPLKEYAEITFKKDSSGKYVPDIESYLEKWKSSYEDLYASKFWENQEALVAADKKERQRTMQEYYNNNLAGRIFVNNFQNSSEDKDSSYCVLQKLKFNSDMTIESETETKHYGIEETETEKKTFSCEIGSGYILANLDDEAKLYVMGDECYIVTAERRYYLTELPADYDFYIFYHESTFENKNEITEYEVYTTHYLVNLKTAQWKYLWDDEDESRGTCSLEDNILTLVEIYKYDSGEVYEYSQKYTVAEDGHTLTAYYKNYDFGEKE